MNTPSISPTAKKTPKPKGVVRTEAVVPFLIVATITWSYFFFLFDRHLKSGIEFIGYQVIGAQVDIDKLETSFLKGSFHLQGLQVTNSQKPTHNMVTIGDIRFKVLWDGLLRAKFVVDEMAVEQIQIDTTRTSPGKVKPPPPPPDPKDNKPSKLETEAKKLKDKALNETQKKYDQNVLGDLASLLNGGSSEEQLKKIEGSLKSKAKLTELQTLYAEKSKSWDQQSKSLPTQKEVQSLGERLSKIKSSNFKNPQELVDSLNQLKALSDEASAKADVISKTSKSLSADFAVFDSGLKELNELVKADTADLENRFHIPKLDAKSLSEGLLRPYLAPYLARLDEYKTLADKYLPPNLMKKDKPDEVDLAMQPRPRAKGVTYEFGRQHSYPLFWIKKVSISSKANAALEIGNMSGLITDITSNQALIQKPTVATLTGDFPSLNLSGFSFKGTFDNLAAQSKIKYDLDIKKYSIDGRPLVATEQAHVDLKKAQAAFESHGSLVGLKNIDFSFHQGVSEIQYQVNSSNSQIQDILNGVFAGLPQITITASGKGELPDFALGIESNIGSEIQKGFEREVQKKINEARQKIQSQIQEQVGAEKAKLEGEYNKVKSQFSAEVAKIQAQLDARKKDAENKANQAKKDEENKAKNSLQKEGEKVVDDLKKKFGL